MKNAKKKVKTATFCLFETLIMHIQLQVNSCIGITQVKIAYPRVKPLLSLIKIHIHTVHEGGTKHECKFGDKTYTFVTNYNKVDEQLPPAQPPPPNNTQICRLHYAGA